KDCYVKDTKDKGRAVFATRAFEPGEIVYKQAPVASILHPWLCETHCSGCFQKATTTSGVLRTCSRCKVARYCSSQCQAMDWKAGHKRECCIIGRLLDAGMTTQQLSDCFLAWRVASDAEKFHKAMSMCALSKPSDAIALTAMQFLSILSSCRSKSIPDFDSILGLLVRFPCNNFAIVDDLWSGIGAGVYPAAALFNHSCEEEHSDIVIINAL
ncbi:Zinc finger MYND domain-containing protein 15, partial [Perkinsus olseni]